MAAIERTSTHHDEHGGHAEGHQRFLAHHFENQEQQFDAGQLGMWLFLVQEILFFSGLFCAYAIYRSTHPEIFVYADHFLDRKLGALNTVVLLFSSFTIAWAVAATQRNQRKLAIGLLIVTFVCAGAFLLVKSFEYRHKFHEHLLWGKNYHPEASLHPMSGSGHTAQKLAEPGVVKSTAAPSGPLDAATDGKPVPSSAANTSPATAPPAAQAEELEEMHPSLPNRGQTARDVPKNVHIFFGIYFAMTGLHAIHVIIGMGVIAWIVFRSIRGDFSAQYFGPVEFTGLYWHLVDLVWIYLFPLLYLIH